MKKTINNRTEIRSNNGRKGQWLAKEIQSMMDNNEPINTTITVEYTRPEDGVMPQYDIRTDRWDLVQGAMDRATMAAKNEILKRTEAAKATQEGTDAPE